MAYRNGETMRLEEARNLGIYPNGVLDIGAHSGQFYGWAKRVWPDVPVFMIEANPLHETKLKNMTFMMDDEYLIAALGDEERDVTFYTRSDKPHTEGNSYYKESNYWDIPQLVQESKVTLQKLDNLFEDDSVFDIIKVDTQGSEIDILKGGKDLVSKAQAIILEVSFIPYNDGAPDSQETIEYMNEIGFEERMSVGEHYDGDTIVQKDLLFTNKELVR
jgi:FkbM family methyltransferase|tara:strand:+ start:1680 stop:2333 length:654 start_codon:yes stop_codon:yes gene_type:complete